MISSIREGNCSRTRLIANKGPAHALTVTYLVPVFAVLYGVVFLKESVNAWMLLSATVIIGGTALSTGLLQPARWRWVQGSA